VSLVAAAVRRQGSGRELPEVTTMSFETNLRAAGQAIADVRFVCAFGAANKPVDVARNRTASGQGISLTTILDIMLVNDYNTLGVEAKPRAERIPIDAALGKEFRNGTCETQASIAFEFLRSLGTRPIDFMTNNNDTHAFLLIGRTGAATNWSDWGAEAVVCDPWLNESPNVSVNGAGAGSEAWPFKPAVWAAKDLVLGRQTPRKLSSYTFKSEYQLTA
jgi:hypothetical protein